MDLTFFHYIPTFLYPLTLLCAIFSFVDCCIIVASFLLSSLLYWQKLQTTTFRIRVIVHMNENIYITVISSIHSIFYIVYLLELINCLSTSYIPLSSERVSIPFTPLCSNNCYNFNVIAKFSSCSAVPLSLYVPIICLCIVKLVF